MLSLQKISLVLEEKGGKEKEGKRRGREGKVKRQTERENRRGEGKEGNKERRKKDL